MGDFYLVFFMLRSSGAQNIAKKRYMKYTLSLGLVGVRHPSVPVANVWSREFDF